MPRHFVHTLAAVSKPNNPVKHFDSIISGRVKKAIYFTAAHLVVVTFTDGIQTGVSIKIRSPNCSLLVERDIIAKQVGAFERPQLTSS